MRYEPCTLLPIECADNPHQQTCIQGVESRDRKISTLEPKYIISWGLLVI